MAPGGRIHEGMKVYGADGRRLGRVTMLADADFLVEKGFFFPKDFLCDYGGIRDIRGEAVFLSRSERELVGAASREATVGLRPPAAGSDR